MWKRAYDIEKSQTTKAVYHAPVCTPTIEPRICIQGYPGNLHTDQLHRSELPTLTYDSIGNMDLFLDQISEMLRQYGISDDHRSECITQDPDSRSPLPVSCDESTLDGNVFNEPNFDRRLAPDSKTKCVQGWSSACEFGKKNLGILQPDSADISSVGGLNLHFGSAIIPSQLMSLREIIHEDRRHEFVIVNDILYNTSRADGNTILYGHDITFRQDRGCRMCTGISDDLIHANPNENGQAYATSPKRGIHTSGVSGAVSEGSIKTMILSQHGQPGTVLQGAGTAHLSETTGAERSRSHAMSKHDSIDSMIRLYGVQLYGILLGGLVVLSYIQLY